MDDLRNPLITVWLLKEVRVCQGASSAIWGQITYDPAAVKAGVLKEGEKVRFEFHNLRHSWASFLARRERT